MGVMNEDVNIINLKKNKRNSLMYIHLEKERLRTSEGSYKIPLHRQKLCALMTFF